MTRGRGGWLDLTPYGSFIRYSMSVYPDAFGPSHTPIPNSEPRTQNPEPGTSNRDPTVVLFNLKSPGVG